MNLLNKQNDDSEFVRLVPSYEDGDDITDAPCGARVEIWYAKGVSGKFASVGHHFLCGG